MNPPPQVTVRIHCGHCPTDPQITVPATFTDTGGDITARIDRDKLRAATYAHFKQHR